MRKLQVEFESIESKPGVLDLAIRYDGNSGSFEYVVEENGIPVSVPAHIVAGVLAIVQAHVVNKLV